MKRITRDKTAKEDEGVSAERCKRQQSAENFGVSIINRYIITVD